MLGTFLATLSRMFELRPFHEAALKALFTPQTKENHVLCISPTGSGKSLIYEKSVETESLRSLLITPLIALGRQQSQKLSQKNLNVWLGTGGMNEVPNSKEPGIWIVSPETLLYLSKKGILKKWRPNFLVVDECHYLWEWGDQFRPAFFYSEFGQRIFYPKKPLADSHTPDRRPSTNKIFITQFIDRNWKV